jgi:putative acetyltransferase
MTPIIEQMQPDTPAAVELITELEEHLGSLGYPDHSRHGYSVDKLIQQKVDFFVIVAFMAPASGFSSEGERSYIGCGGLQRFADYAELKRMYIRPQFQGQGHGQMMLRHLCAFARHHGISTVRLETGIHQHPAIKLYERFGFQRRAPFGEYRLDPNSIYYEIEV